MLEIKQNLYLFLHTFSGASPATISTFILYPIEIIRIQLQQKFVKNIKNLKKIIKMLKKNGKTLK